MKMIRTTTLLGLMLLILLWPNDKAVAENQDCLFAQMDPDELLAQVLDEMPPDEPLYGFGQGPPRNIVPEQRRKHLEQFRMLKLLELIDLSEEQEIEFITVYRGARKNQQRLDRQREELLNELAIGLREQSIADSRIIEIANELQRFEEEKLKQRAIIFAKMNNLLTPEQFGKLLVFQGRFELELLKACRGMGRDHNRKGNRP